ncbi:MAG: CARDB domain-containing protein, partial [Pseudobdellovibrionaceae bacterium]
GASVTIQTNGGAYLIPSGSHTIGAFVDDSNRFAESNKNNNTLTQSITVNSLPDVIVTSVSYSNGIFTSVVKNQGAGATPSGVVIGVGYFVDGVYRTWGVVNGPLAAGASVTIQTNGGAYLIPSGSHTIGAFVDDSQRFTESNENNNKLSRTIWVP